MNSTMLDKFESLEREINRCLREKEECETSLGELEHQQMKLARYASTKANKAFTGTDIEKDVAQLVKANAEIRHTVSAMEEILQDIELLLREMKGTYRSRQKEVKDQQQPSEDGEDNKVSDVNESPASSDNSGEVDNSMEEMENREDSGDKDDKDDSDGDLLGGLANLLTSPAVQKMLPALLKGLTK